MARSSGFRLRSRHYGVSGRHKRYRNRWATNQADRHPSTNSLVTSSPQLPSPLRLGILRIDILEKQLGHTKMASPLASKRYLQIVVAQNVAFIKNTS